MRAHQVHRSLRVPALGTVAALAVWTVVGVPAVHAQAAGPASQPAAALQATAAAPAGNTEKGKQLYMTYYCYACHGTDGQGGAATGITPNTSAFAYFRNYLRKPAGNMPPYLSRALPDVEVGDIYAYLRSIPRGPAAKSIPLLNQ